MRLTWRRSWRLWLVSLLSGSIGASGALANNGVPVCIAPQSINDVQVAPDGNGGAFLAWSDNRQLSSRAFAQHLDSLGRALWGPGGTFVHSSGSVSSARGIVSDQQGGAFVAYLEFAQGSPQIYVQRLAADGSPMWAGNGTPVNETTIPETFGSLIPDGSGGVVVAWHQIASNDADAWIQRVDPIGNRLFGLNGSPIVGVAGNQTEVAAALSPDGMFLVSWLDSRLGAPELYAQKFSQVGARQWANQGVLAVSGGESKFEPTLIADSTGGAILAFVSLAQGVNYDVHVQRIASGGNSFPWGVAGVRLSTLSGHQQSPRICLRPGGGVFAAWNEQTFHASDVYGQRVEPDGALAWGEEGIPVGVAPYSKQDIAIALGAGSHALVAWTDVRNAATVELYLQEVTPAGNLLNGSGGRLLVDAPGSQAVLRASTSGAGPWVLAWTDYRYDPVYGDLFATKVASGEVGIFEDPEPPHLVRVADVPNDQGGRVRLSWDAAYLDGAPFFDPVEYRVFREVRDPQAFGARFVDPASIRPEGETTRHENLVLRDAAGAVTYWEFLASVSSAHLPGYSFVAATTSDSLPGSNARTSFLIQAWKSDHTRWWFSNVDSGYSIDNLPPAAPADVQAVHSGVATSLTWAGGLEPDFQTFRLFRAPTLQTPRTGWTQIHEGASHAFIDTAPGAWTYRLLSADRSGNESAVVSILPTGVTSVDQAVSPLPLGLISCGPSPSRGRLSVSFRVGEAAGVELSLFDVASRHRVTLAKDWKASGAHRLEFDLIHALGSDARGGIYFVVLEAAGRRWVTPVVFLP